MLSWLRRWLKPASRQGHASVSETVDGGTLNVADDRSATDASLAPLPDEREIAVLHCRELFLASGIRAPDLTEQEHDWLQARREQLRGGSEDLTALVPRLPAVMPRLMVAVNEPGKTSARELAALIEADAVLAANVLKVVNSPAFRTRREDVDSLDQAVIVMGFAGIREAIAAAAISPIMGFDRDPRLDPQALRLVWPLTLRTAAAVRKAAQRAGFLDAFELYLAALTHNSGLMTLLRSLDSLDEAKPSEAFIAGLETMARRYSAAIARGWNLPEVTASCLDGWAAHRHSDEASALLGQAVAYMQVTALAGSGRMDANLVERMRRQLPYYAQDWGDADMLSGRVRDPVQPL